METYVSQLIDWIYQNSSLNPFLKMIEAPGPVFKFNTLVGTHEISLQNYREDIIVIKTPEVQPSLDVVTKRVLLGLENQFRQFMDNNCTIERISFYKNNQYKPSTKYFRVNTRFHLNSKKAEINHSENIIGIIEQCQRELYDYYHDETFYVIVSREIANFIGHACCYSIPSAFSTFKIDTMKADPVFIHPFAVFQDLRIFVDPNMNQNTMIFGTNKRFDHGNIMFYYKADRSFFEYASVGYLDVDKKLCVNLFHTIQPIDYEPKFKKIILDV